MSFNRYALSMTIKIISPFIFAAIILISAANIYGHLSFLPFAEIISAIDRGATASRDQLKQTRDEAQLSSRRSPKCSDRQDRGELTIAIASARTLTSSDSQEYSSSIRKQLSVTAEQRLRCNPLDGNAWLLKGISLYENKQDSPLAIRDVFFSCKFSPNEKWIIDHRLPFLGAISSSVDSSTAACMRNDLMNLVKFYPPATAADFYLSSGNEIRSQIKVFWTKLDLSSRIAIARAVDRVGLVLDRRFWVEEVMKDR